MPLAPELVDFVTKHPDAAMITLRDNGTPHMARIEICVVDGRLRATGAPSLVRTRNLRRDPRCSLFVFGPHPFWLGLETEVTIAEGEVGQDLIQLLRARHGTGPAGTVLAHDDELGHDRPYTEAEYVAHARASQLLIYDFGVLKAYGNYVPA
ncbi:pyridoxamine 5'-phosphate oxidase family protein [Mycobacteroides franklinii]|uniref:Pyridoxamine 5'-phosphate oxidase n=1 Tax=Mycobacteroides franklinii TaxID=948102 RepID=A0A4R8R2Q6_9MYCO|nr:pyridoxamine 5'-phosphate oxidase family protein [Mycobacteroides franklinii]TDZ43276.1 Pyridoxamine 5'-phosphate oxidase [Mycobacteroides franklinii]TDZ50411.1 Pyridoxamine 5'-phosphate oxidase [Mycobacteroides franklinii]TDZ56831.1 Pyridoxamine 5'-phosphate oxidase [Mycobacteroides franklinii]TDZ63772.1 Pyridoxamine 5'-phosphate oxidase [Mycobacteroides franklinii]TDZ70169.1 Pyridoxamine 5'-phosphate oxidase [Mycobacteroides franklinii]